MTAKMSTGTPWWCRILIGFFVVFALAQVLERGPIDWRGNFALHDFNMFYSASSVWLEGGNAYDRSTLFPAWLARGGDPGVQFHEFWTMVLPPGALALISPLTLLPVKAALVIWTLIGAASIALMIWSVISLTHLRGWKCKLFIAIAIALAPVQTLLALGQGSLPVIALTLFGLERARHRKDILAGVLMGLATCIKPQLALPVLMYFVFYRRWRVIAPALACVLLANGIAAVRLQIDHPGWHALWASNIAATSAPGAQDDNSLTGPWRHQMIHLPTWLNTFISNPQLAKAISWSFCLAIAGIFLAVLMQVRTHYRQELLALSTIAALMLLPIYHKSYDAAIVLLALGWALRNVNLLPDRRYAWAVLAALSVFLVPFDLLPMVMQRTDKLNALAQTTIWRRVIYPHHALGTLLLALTLLWTFFATVRRSVQMTTEERRRDLRELLAVRLDDDFLGIETATDNARAVELEVAAVSARSADDLALSERDESNGVPVSPGRL